MTFAQLGYTRPTGASTLEVRANSGILDIQSFQDFYPSPSQPTHKAKFSDFVDKPLKFNHRGKQGLNRSVNKIQCRVNPTFIAYSFFGLSLVKIKKTSSYQPD
jgi:hypothetical protein